MSFVRRFALAALVLLAACAATDGLDDPPPALGDFRLGHNIVVGRTARMVPPSRAATGEEWVAAFAPAIQQRLGRHQGEGLYHLGISVDAYALAIPGVPVVLKPRSILVFSITVWDNATGQKINIEADQLTAFESLGLSGESFIGSGLTQTKEEQMANLSRRAALAIERWLVENEAWFSADAELRAAARAEAAKPTPPGQPSRN